MGVRSTILASAVLAVAPAVAAAQTGLIPYDGTLLSAGAPADGYFDVTFELWDDATADLSSACTASPHCLWEGDYQSPGAQVSVANGRFSVMLGEYTALPATVWTAANLYLQVRVSGVLLNGRQQLGTVPLAPQGNTLKLNQLTANQVTSTGAITAGGRISDKTGLVMPVGTMLPYAGSTAPTGWLLCDGSAIARAGTYADLYTAIGTTYGAGDGVTTFNIPDMRGIFLRGAGTAGTLTQANGNAYAATAGTYQTDSLQGFKQEIMTGVGPLQYSGGGGTGCETLNGQATCNGSRDYAQGFYDAGNGAPRVDNETRPANLAMSFIIKY